MSEIWGDGPYDFAREAHDAEWHSPHGPGERPGAAEDVPTRREAEADERGDEA
jgi:hypothetical protein